MAAESTRPPLQGARRSPDPAPADQRVFWIAFGFALLASALVAFGLKGQERYLAARAAAAEGRPLLANDSALLAALGEQLDPELRTSLRFVAWGAAAASTLWLMLLQSLPASTPALPPAPLAP